jgi:hypothetical protein
MIPAWSTLNKIKVTPQPVFQAKVEIYAIEEGGKWAASLHSGGAMKLMLGSGSLRSGVEEAMRSVSGRQHIQVLTGPEVDPDQFGHIVKLTAKCREGPDFERLRIALGLSEGGIAQRAGIWNEGLPQHRGREKSKKKK